MPLLTAENVSFSYDKKINAVSGVNITAECGEYVSVIGHNGSGKSTLAKLFNALLIPDSGTVTVDGFCSSDKKALFEIRKRVGVVFQNPDNQLVASIVEDDVAFGPENLGVPRKEIGERIDYALKAVGMEEFRKSSPERLSGGQKHSPCGRACASPRNSRSRRIHGDARSAGQKRHSRGGEKALPRRRRYRYNHNPLYGRGFRSGQGIRYG